MAPPEVMDIETASKQTMEPPVVTDTEKAMAPPLATDIAMGKMREAAMVPPPTDYK